MIKKICLPVILAFGLGLTSEAEEVHNFQPLLDSIMTTVEQAVGAKISDGIPGGYAYAGPYDAFLAGGVECPESIPDVKRALDLLSAKLSSTFTNRITGLRSEHFARDGDIVILARVHDANDTKIVMRVKITIFKRSSSRVILFVCIGSPFRGDLD